MSRRSGQGAEPRRSRSEMYTAMGNIREIARMLMIEAHRVSGGRTEDVTVGWSQFIAATTSVRHIRSNPTAWTLYSRGLMDGAHSVRTAGRRREAATGGQAGTADVPDAAGAANGAGAADVTEMAVVAVNGSPRGDQAGPPEPQGLGRRRRRRGAARRRDPVQWAIQLQPDEIEQELSEMVEQLDGRALSPPAMPPRPIYRW